MQVFLRQTKSKVADPSGSGYSDLEEWVLDTEGVNLAEVWFDSAPLAPDQERQHSECIAQLLDAAASPGPGVVGLPPCYCTQRCSSKSEQ